MYAWMKQALTGRFTRIQQESSTETPMETQASNQQEYVERYPPPNVIVQSDQIEGDSHDVSRLSELLDEADKMIKLGKVQEFMNLFKGNAKLMGYVNVRNLFGYTLLQRAVINNNLDLVQFLSEIGADINGPICGRVLHLAAKLGHAPIVELLLRLGADPNVLSCVCYPEDHCGTTFTYDPVLQKWTLKCACDLFSSKPTYKRTFEYPLYYAVLSNSVETVELLTSKQVMLLYQPKPLLHLASQLGASRCVKLFRELCPSDVAVKDEAGYTPLMYAVKHDVDIVKYLVANGSEVLVKSEKEETLLHLAISQRNIMFNISEVIEYLLTCGLGMYVNALDSNSLSPLSALLKQMHKSTDTYIKELEDERSATLDQCHNAEFIKVCQMLLESGANPNIPDKFGQTSLHILLFCNSVGLRCWQQRLNLACDLLPLLLSRGANPNIKNFSGSYVVEDFMEATLCHIFPSPMLPPIISGLECTVSYVVSVLRQLAQAGTDLTACSTCLVHLAASNQLSVLADIEHLMHTREQMEQNTSTILRGFEEIIRVLVTECKASVNHCGCHYSIFNSIYYRLACHSGIVTHESMKKIVLMLLECGADLNLANKAEHLDKFSIRPNNINISSPPLQHLFYLMLMGEDHKWDKLKDLMTVLLHAMDHDLVMHCLYLVMVYIGDKKDDKSQRVSALVTHYMNVPMSLQHHCRTAIYKALHRRLYLVQHLPLPASLKHYILEFL